MTLECVVPIKNYNYPKSKTRLNTAKSFSSDLSIMFPFLKIA